MTGLWGEFKASHLVVDLQVGRPHEVLAARSSVILYAGKDVLHSARYDAPVRALMLTLHGVGFASASLAISNDGSIVPLSSNSRSDPGCLGTAFRVT